MFELMCGRYLHCMDERTDVWMYGQMYGFLRIHPYVIYGQTSAAYIDRRMVVWTDTWTHGQHVDVWIHLLVFETLKMRGQMFE